MKKTVSPFGFLIIFCLLTLSFKPEIIDRSMDRGEKWSLVWEENFDEAALDSTKWSRIGAGNADWDRHMSRLDSCYDLRNGNLILKGIVNTVDKNDARPYLTGGVTTQGKFSFLYGKIEICAKLGCAKGAWPAFWMMGENIATIGWPKCGEIDIMEHLNSDGIVYQTAHSYYTYTLNEKWPVKGDTARINKGEYNVYGLEWTPDELAWTVNGNKTFSYPRTDTDKEGQWPFNTPFFILIDMQLGGQWVGPVDLEDLPVEMAIDWVRVSQLKK